jgi:hypothetical protein
MNPHGGQMPGQHGLQSAGPYGVQGADPYGAQAAGQYGGQFHGQNFNTTSSSHYSSHSAGQQGGHAVGQQVGHAVPPVRTILDQQTTGQSAVQAVGQTGGQFAGHTGGQVVGQAGGQNVTQTTSHQAEIQTQQHGSAVRSDPVPRRDSASSDGSVSSAHGIKTTGQQHTAEINVTHGGSTAEGIVTTQRRQARHHKEVIRLPDQTQGQVRQVRHRLPTPEPDTIERVFMQRTGGEVVEEITEIPMTPPPRITERTVVEPAGPPQVIKKTIRVPPRGGGYGAYQTQQTTGAYQQHQQTTGAYQQHQQTTGAVIGSASSSSVSQVAGGAQQYGGITSATTGAAYQGGYSGAAPSTGYSSYGGGYQQQGYGAVSGGSFPPPGVGFGVPFMTTLTPRGPAPSLIPGATCFYT